MKKDLERLERGEKITPEPLSRLKKLLPKPVDLIKKAPSPKELPVLKQIIEEKTEEPEETKKLLKIVSKKIEEYGQKEKMLTIREERLAEREKGLKQRQEPVQKKIPKAKKKKPEEKEKKIKAKKPINLRKILISLIIIFAIIILGIFIYNWLLAIHPAPSLPQQPQQPQQPEPLAETEKEEIPQIPAPLSLIPVDQDIIIDQEDFFNQLDLTSSGISQIAIKSNSAFLNLSDLLDFLLLQMPESLLNNLENSYTLILASARLGLIIETKDNLAVLAEMNRWEKSMAQDLTGLFIESAPETPTEAQFKINTDYPHIIIHYLNLPVPNNSLNYTLVKNKLIITTSRINIYLVLDRILEE